MTVPGRFFWYLGGGGGGLVGQCRTPVPSQPPSLRRPTAPVTDRTQVLVKINRETDKNPHGRFGACLKVYLSDTPNAARKGENRDIDKTDERERGAWFGEQGLF